MSIHRVSQSNLSTRVDGASARPTNAELGAEDARERKAEGRSTRIAADVVPRNARSDRRQTGAGARLARLDQARPDRLPETKRQVRGAHSIDEPGVEPRLR